MRRIMSFVLSVVMVFLCFCFPVYGYSFLSVEEVDRAEDKFTDEWYCMALNVA